MVGSYFRKSRASVMLNTELKRSSVAPRFSDALDFDTRARVVFNSYERDRDGIHYLRYLVLGECQYFSTVFHRIDTRDTGDGDSSYC